MKIFLLTTLTPALATAFAFQSPYLSQLGRAGASTNGASYAPPTEQNINGGSTPELVQSLQGTSTVAPSQELLDLWSNQVSVELSASQLYLSASIWFRAREMDGMAAWMLDESGEERGHGLAILEFAMKKHFPVHLKQLPAPRSDWREPVDVWEDILQAEKTNTQNLLRLAAAAEKCQDYAAVAFLNPFHIEQLEAEDKVGAILATIREAPGMVRELDYKLGLEAEEEGEDHH